MSNLYKTSIITNMAHIFSVVTGYVVGTYKSFIPKDYFKTVHIMTKIPIAQDQDGDKNGYLKKSKPILAVKPRIEFDFDSEYLNAYFSTMNMFDPKDRNNLNNVFQDYEHDMYLDMSLRRIRFSFDINIIVETQIQQQNLAYYMINKIEPGSPYYLRDTVIETVIPRGFINEIAKRAGFTDANGNITNISQFVTYMNSNSRQPVTYKMKTSSGNHEFFTSYLTDAIINFESVPSLDDGETKGQISTNFNITHNCVVDVTIPGFTYFSIMTEDFNFNIDPSFDELSALMNVEVYPIIPLYYEAIPKTNSEGWHITVHSGYEVVGEVGEERIPIHQLLTPNQNRVLKYHSDNGINQSFLDVVVYENKDIITAPGRVTIDYTDLSAIEMVITNMSEEKSYYLCIYENNNYMNSILKKMEKVST